MKIKIIDDESILDATAIKIEEGMRPYRLVWRKANGPHSYSVHSETLVPKPIGDVLEFHHEDFYDGSYFTNEHDALACFLSKKIR